ncbi:hypothetical protein SCUCBS95973_003528 [Sporothrix curviconia]|uniref:Zn(2)-C6 fungal-type domain-containing protein n=1 Tax=Sporothrix curviconia TaxID=1260050 RepID=A0ABP0BH85_9PEZI
MPAATLMDQNDMSAAAVDEPIAASETTEGSTSNPRKRKKSSRACDFCHVNHQPCDNAKPRCSYCERHGKTCLYLRPQKKRGPAQGYRSALHSMRESAAAWGAALNLIPSLGPVIEGYLQKEEGKRLIRAIKDPQQQEFFIQSWQQSSVFRSFFGDEESLDGAEAAEGGGGEAAFAPPAASGSITADCTPTPGGTNTITMASGPPSYLPPPQPPQPPQPQPQPQPSTTDADASASLDLFSIHMPPSLQPPPPPSLTPSAPTLTFSPNRHLHPHQHQHQHHQAPPVPYDLKLESLLHSHPGSLSHPQDHALQGPSDGMGGLGGMHTSLTDMVARDAARASTSFSQTLGSLGFAPDETFSDFLNISYNLDPADTTTNQDPLLGSELDQKAYYELLMGRKST